LKIPAVKAAEELVKKNFEVYPYCSDDVILCQRLMDLGCVCVMPLGSPIGSGRGIQNPYNISVIKKKVTIPVIVDAGIGTASDACRAMELGVDGILLNTAIAKAGYPIQMAAAMRDAVLSGRNAFLARRITIQEHADVSTPEEGKIRYYKMKK
jgi:thiazole synthase